MKIGKFETHGSLFFQKSQTLKGYQFSFLMRTLKVFLNGCDN
jgi:hypothetical protein